MQSENDMNSEDSNKGKGDHQRRKRINHIKTAIVVVVIILLLLPTVCCIILGLQVSRLQKQVDILSKMHGQNGLTVTMNGENIVYAAEISNDPEYTEDQNADNNEKLIETASDISEASEVNSGKISPENIAGNQNSAIDKNNSLNAITDDHNDAIEKEINTDSNNKQAGIYAGKKVYITFDDGPSKYTDDILDILNEYQVKATFFVVGKSDDKSKEMYRRIVDEGHTLGMHSYSHNYKKIYNSVEDFDKDFTKLWKLLYDTTGYKPSIFRFPGGSDNKVNKNGMEDFVKYLNDASIVYYDWNVLNGDATGITYTKDQLIKNVLDGVKIKKTSIVLLHDARDKKNTVESLPELLEALKSEGAIILPLDNEVPPIQMIKADSIH